MASDSPIVILPSGKKDGKAGKVSRTDKPSRAEVAKANRADTSLVGAVRQALLDQAGELARLAHRVDQSFAAAVTTILSAQGRVAVIGVGKSGIVGRKIASTMASTGTPAVFVNAAEARHGDLGMITSDDVVVVISYSGETEEVTHLLPHLSALEVPMIAIVGAIHSSLATAADIVLDVNVLSETCPLGLAPTTSTLTTLAMGDALAIALMRERRFGVDDFRRTHPGGALGRKLGARVKDVMHGPPLPVVAPGDTVGRSLATMSDGRLGVLLVQSGPRLVGLVTDGDLRRAMVRDGDIREVCVAEIMTRNPATISEDAPVSEAQARMRTLKLKCLIVLDAEGHVSGVIDVFDNGHGVRG
jgi:arabinose-5-phosphate isomerase